MPESAARRVLLDENVDRQLKPLFEPGFDVRTSETRVGVGCRTERY